MYLVHKWGRSLKASTCTCSAICLCKLIFCSACCICSNNLESERTACLIHLGLYSCFQQKAGVAGGSHATLLLS